MLKSTKKNAVLIPILILFGINMVLSAVNITHWMAKDNFRTFSESNASDLIKQLKPRVSAAVAMLPGNASPADIKSTLDGVILSTNPVAYEVLDPSSNSILFSSAPPRTEADTGGSSDHTGVQIVDGRDRFTDSGATRQYSHAVFALPENDAALAQVRIFIDQSNALALFYATHKNIAIVSAMFLAAALSLLIYVVWSRLKEQWQADEKIRRLAHYDGLTDLLKREAFNENLDYAISRLEADRTVIALLCLDIDNFKRINDTMGHATGDALLQQFADRLKDSTRKTDLLCRMGGDEFCVALRDLKSAERVLPFSNRLCEKLGEPYVIDGREITTTVSIGVAIAPSDANDAATMFKCADLALYRSKSEGRNTVRFFETEMDTAFQRRLQLGEELKEAIDADQFVLHYQPQFDLKTGALTGREALLRWMHPAGGIVKPDAFIPVAEETGLIIPLSRWILERACQDAKERRWRGKLAINLSPLQFMSGNVVELVAETLQKTEFPAEQLELEITETLLMSNMVRVTEALGQLKAMGVIIVLDDFGTGYSSLSYLTSFPFDKIKIDRSFVGSLSTNPTAQVIVRAIIGLGHDLDMSITAEGVETRAQEALLRSWGCDQAQGFLYGQPDVPTADETLTEHTEAVVYPAFLTG